MRARETSFYAFNRVFLRFTRERGVEKESSRKKLAGRERKSGGRKLGKDRAT